MFYSLYNLIITIREWTERIRTIFLSTKPCFYSQGSVQPVGIAVCNFLFELLWVDKSDIVPNQSTSKSLYILLLSRATTAVYKVWKVYDIVGINKNLPQTTRYAYCGRQKNNVWVYRMVLLYKRSLIDSISCFNFTSSPVSRLIFS